MCYPLDMTVGQHGFNQESLITEWMRVGQMDSSQQETCYVPG